MKLPAYFNMDVCVCIFCMYIFCSSLLVFESCARSLHQISSLLWVTTKMFGSCWAKHGRGAGGSEWMSGGCSGCLAHLHTHILCECDGAEPGHLQPRPCLQGATCPRPLLSSLDDLTKTHSVLLNTCEQGKIQ